MIDILRKRRSIRKFKQLPVENSKLKTLEEAILRSPSSRNLKPWKFIFVTDKKLLKKLAEAKSAGGKFLEDAPLAVVVLGDAEVSDAWIEDCSIAATILQLTAETLDLGSCWVQIRGRKHSNNLSASAFIRKELHIHAEMEVASVIALGYPDEEKEPVSEHKLDWEKTALLV